MSEEKILDRKLYEGMFLLDVAKGGGNFPEHIRQISELLQRHEAQIEQIEKWGERKLAYKIKHVERGIYVLVFFRADPSRIAELRRAINRSEDILRVLILQVDKVAKPSGELFTPEGAPCPAEQKAEQPAAGSEPAAGGPGAEEESAVSAKSPGAEEESAVSAKSPGAEEESAVSTKSPGAEEESAVSAKSEGGSQDA